LNATLRVHYLSWVDYKTKYPLILAAGENVDFIFTSDWCMYAQEAAKNAFLEITENDIAKYMPRHYANCNSDAYEQAKLNGKIYMITTSSPDMRVTCLAYRKDLAEKYGITNLNKISDFTDYFKAVRDNEKDISPIYLSASYDNLWLYLANEYGNEINVTNALCTYTRDNEVNIAPLYEEPYVDTIKNAFTIMKQWYDAGYVNKDVLANEMTSREALMEGKSAIAIGNTVDMQSVLSFCENKGYDIGLIPLLDKQGKTSAVPYLNNGVAIAASSENPERTMMVLDLLMEEKEYNYLLYYGIEGKNYVITDDGKIGLPNGVTDETNSYPVDAAGFWFTNKNQHLPLASWTKDYIELKKEIPSMQYTSPYIEFSPDLTNIQTEVDNISLVTQQYMQPMCFGMADDIDQGMETLKEKLISAGIEKVKAEVQKQIRAYLINK
jgi:putative aldouronate transport system substrate-binding protein